MALDSLQMLASRPPRRARGRARGAQVLRAPGPSRPPRRRPWARADSPSRPAGDFTGRPGGSLETGRRPL